MTGTTKPTETKDAILLAMLANAPFDGWSRKTLNHAALECGCGAAETNALFPGGLADAFDHFSDWADRQMLAALEAENLDEMRVRDRIALGVRARLETLTPHRDCLRQATQWAARPDRGVKVPALVWRTADRLWWAAGDTSTDLNHYSKRALLSGVLTATTLYWLNDTSDDFGKTWAFLDKKIDRIVKIGGFIGKRLNRGGRGRAS